MEDLKQKFVKEQCYSSFNAMIENEWSLFLQSELKEKDKQISELGQTQNRYYRNYEKELNKRKKLEGILCKIRDSTKKENQKLKERVEALEKIAKEVLWWDTTPNNMKEEIKQLLK